jgi:hypothetical protein
MSHRQQAGAELVFPASRKKAVLLLLGCIAFVAAGLMMASEKPLLGWLAVGFFGLGIPASLGLLLTDRVRLRLTEQGIEMYGLLGKPTAIRWSDIARFELATLPAGLAQPKMIAIVYRDGYTHQQGLRNAAAALSGVESGIGDSYRAPRAEVLRTLVEWHARYGGRNP